MAAKSQPVTSGAQPPAAPARKTYHIVNPGGAVHEVTYEHAKELLRQVGFRMATAVEIRQLREQGGHQVFDRPIAPPFTAEPEPDPDIDGLAAEAE